MTSIAPPPAPRLFLIDGYALIYRAFFAMIARPLRTSRGENTSAAWGIANFLQRLIATHEPEYIGWVHDSGLSFRHETYPEYKATREKLTEELQQDFDTGIERIHQLLDCYHIPVLTLHGYEADDVIGTLAARGVERGMSVVVVSGDKDFQQLVRPGVWLINPGRGGPAAVDEQWVGMENAVERLGVPPERVVDYLALVGDSSDNVPGVKGIGDKTARELVEQYGPIEEILAHAGEITKKRPREALLAYADAARLSKQLVTIRSDLPVDLELERLRVRQPDEARLRELLIELEFHTLVKEVAPAARGPAAGTRMYRTVDTPDAVRAAVAAARAAPIIAVDTETMIEIGPPQPADPLRSRLVGLSIATAAGEACYFPFGHRRHTGDEHQGELLSDVSGDRAPTDDPEDRAVPMMRKTAKARKSASAAQASLSIAGRALAEHGVREPRNLPPLDSEELRPLRELLEDPDVPKVMHNAKYDLLALRRAGVALRGVRADTMLASYVLDPGRRGHGSDVLALELLDYTMTTYEELCGKGKGAVPFDECPVDCARDYSCEDADVAWRLWARFERQLEEMGATPLFRDIEMPLSEVLADMEAAGITIDLAWFASLKARFAAERERVERLIWEEAGEEFNIASNPQLRVILFEKLGLPVRKRTATGPSTDATVLQELADEGHTLPTLLMEYRELSKLESTYLDALPALVNPETGRLHTSFNQTVASTGRLSSSDPNLQNIPIRRELGRSMRRGFIPRQGWRLLAADYSQIELRLLAHLSGDEAFVAAFRAGGDIHRQTASVIFDLPLDAVTPEMRARAKTINFATIYGQGPFSLSRQLKIEQAEAKAFIAQYFERFSGVRGYLDRMVEFAKSNGYVETLFGRRRYIPELRDRNFNVRAFGERTATNSPIQGSAADLIKIAMIHIHHALRTAGHEARMLLQVHDELVFEVPPDEIDAVRALVIREMEHAAALDVPLVVDVGIGENWMETKE
ncbi:MAG TPA: DNA polymerase I [Gemmatimonadaceae bacterium]|nr:DNA polymerase I [Gemmatimonadaceae bacterium]